MMADMLKYSQIIWAYFIIDAMTLSTAKYINVPQVHHTYKLEEQSSELHPYSGQQNITFDHKVLPSQMGLFVAQPIQSNVLPIKPGHVGTEPHNGRYLSFVSQNKKRQGTYPEHLSLFSNIYLQKHKPMIIQSQPYNQYHTPGFNKFKNELDHRTETSHAQGPKMGKDAVFSPSIAYAKPSIKNYNKLKASHHLTEKLHRRPVYGKPGLYDDFSYTSHSTPSSYQSSYSSIPHEPYLPLNFHSSDSSYLPHSSDIESDLLHLPHSDPEVANNGLPKEFSLYTFHTTLPHTPLPHHREEKEDEVKSDYPTSFHKGEMYRDIGLIKKKHTKIMPVLIKDDVGHLGQPYGKPAQVSVPLSKEINEGDDDSKDLLFNNGEEEEEEVIPALIPLLSRGKGKLKQPSRLQHKRVPLEAKKRCVKKQKEMIVDDLDDEAGRQMTCLLCENLETGSTQETCSYESDPQKDYYSTISESSYKQSTPKLSKYRFKRETGVFNDPYNFESDHFEEENYELAEFKPQPPAYANDGSCIKVKKGSTTCKVCQNPETNGKYEQCSYTHDPDEDTHEYAQSSMHGKDNKNALPFKKLCNGKTSEKKIPQIESSQCGSSTETGESEMQISDKLQNIHNTEQQNNASVEIFHQLVRKKKELPNSRFFGHRGVKDSSNEDQFLNIFPDLSLGHEQKHSSLLNEMYGKSILDSDDSMEGFKSKKWGGHFKGVPKLTILDSGEEGGVSEMMRNFATKDRSACTKRMKDKMTCYICDDSDGVKREECMYVVENEPKKVKYQESKHITSPETKTSKREVSQRVDHIYKTVSLNEMKPLASLADSHKYRTEPMVSKPRAYSNIEITYTKQGPLIGSIFKKYTGKRVSDSKYSSKQMADLGPGGASSNDTNHVWSRIQVQNI